jgi:hypothetical protein
VLKAEAAAAMTGSRPLEISADVAKFSYDATGTEEAGKFEMIAFVSGVAMKIRCSGLTCCSSIWSKRFAEGLTRLDSGYYRFYIDEGYVFALSSYRAKRPPECGVIVAVGRSCSHARSLKSMI